MVSSARCIDRSGEKCIHTTYNKCVHASVVFDAHYFFSTPISLLCVQVTVRSPGVAQFLQNTPVKKPTEALNLWAEKARSVGAVGNNHAGIHPVTPLR